MLTLPTAFEQDYKRAGAINHNVVKLTDGVSTWWLSEIDMQIGTTHVYPLLISRSTIIEKIDIQTKAWSVSNMRIVLSNAPYKRKSGAVGWTRLSDELEDILDNEVSIYLLAGSQVATLPDDLLLKYKGIVINAPAYDENNIIIEAIDKGSLSHLTLPQNLMYAAYSTTPNEYELKKIPIVYGEFTASGSDTSSYDFTGLGLAKCWPTDIFQLNDASPPKVVVSDHVLDSIDNNHLYQIDDMVEDPVRHVSASGSVNDSGRGTITGDISCYAYLLTQIDEENYLADYYTAPLGPNYPTDRDDTTKADLRDNVFDDGSDQDGAWAWSIVSRDYVAQLIADLQLDALYLQYLVDDQFNGGSITIFGRFCNIKTSGAIATGTDSLTAAGSWETGSDWSADITEAEARDMGVYIAAGSVGSPDADSTLNNFTCLHIYTLRCRVKYQPKKHGIMYVACKGREYGSWITGRSSNYSSGDAIEDPAGIIESILRDYMGLVTAEIDQPTFIDAENTSVKARINLHSDNEMKTDDIIKQLCEQSTFAFIFAAVGKAKLIPLNDGSPTTVRTILYSEISNGNIQMGKTKKKFTNLVRHERYLQEYGRYVDTNGSPGDITLTVNWPNICGSSASTVVTNLVSIAANERPIIEFEMPGYLGADLEIGDWIELDDTTVDPHIMLYGSSWSGKQFLIYELQNFINHTRVKAIALLES